MPSLRRPRRSLKSYPSAGLTSPPTRRTKSQIVNLSVPVRRTKGGHQMRRERRAISEDAETITYTFHFQITNKGGRQACSVKVQAPNINDATTFFRQNWPLIESMARDGLVSRSGADRTIKLVMP